MNRMCTPVLSIALLLFGCASSTPVPDLIVQEDVAPKLASVLVSTQYFVKTIQRSTHQRALYMPEGLTASVDASKPCQVTFSSNGMEQIKALTYDANARLTEVKVTTTKKGKDGETSTLAIDYDAQGNTTRMLYHPVAHSAHDISYEYKDGVLSRVNFRVKVDEKFHLRDVQTVEHISNGKVVQFQEVFVYHPRFKKGDNRVPPMKSHTFDDQGRVTLVRPMLSISQTPSTWRYYPVNTTTNTQRVDFYPLEGGKIRRTYMLKDSRLMSTVWAAKADDDQEFVPFQTKTYTYEGDKVVSAKTVDAVVGETIETITYAYTCS